MTHTLTTVKTAAGFDYLAGIISNLASIRETDSFLAM